jgi:hypothetical protein
MISYFVNCFSEKGGLFFMMFLFQIEPEWSQWSDWKNGSRVAYAMPPSTPSSTPSTTERVNSTVRPMAVEQAIEVRKMLFVLI